MVALIGMEASLDVVVTLTWYWMALLSVKRVLAVSAVMNDSRLDFRCETGGSGA